MCVFIFSPLSTQLPFLESGSLETEGGASDKAVFAFANHNKKGY